MTIGLVIVTYNAAPFIARVIEALAAQTRRPHRVLIVDNASADGTVAIAERAAAAHLLPIEVLRQPANEGFARANNLGVAALGDCDHIALLNPDAFPEPGWLAALAAAAARHPEAGSFAARLMRDGEPGVLDGAGDVCHVSGMVWRHGHGCRLEDVSDALVEHEVLAPCAAAALYRRVDWIAAGGMDESYFCYVEDVDLGFRLHLSGRACWYVPEAVAWHVGSGIAGVGSPFAVYHGHRNLAWNFVKNMPGRLFWRYLPAHLAMTLASLLWFTAKGRGSAIWRAKRDALIGMRPIWRARRQVQAMRAVPIGETQRRLNRSSLFTRLVARAGRASG